MDDVTAEFAAGELAPPPPLRVTTTLRYGARTDIGRVRENNEDKYEILDLRETALGATRGAIFVVCDGMGGHAAGQVASELGAKTFLDVFVSHPSYDAELALTESVRAANRKVRDAAQEPGKQGMGSTLSGLVIVQGVGYTVQLGDSRVYRLRNGAVEVMTPEHSFVAEMTRNGTMSPEEAGSHPYRNMITRALGAEASCQPETSALPLEPGDVFVLVSDGVTNHVSDDRLGELIRHLDPELAARVVVDEALDGGGLDNATAIVVRIEGLMTHDAEPTP